MILDQDGNVQEATSLPTLTQWDTPQITSDNVNIFISFSDAIYKYDLNGNYIETYYPFIEYPNCTVQPSRFIYGYDNNYYLENRSPLIYSGGYDLYKLSYDGFSFSLIEAYPSLRSSSIGTIPNYLFHTFFEENPPGTFLFTIRKLLLDGNINTPPIIWEFSPFPYALNSIAVNPNRDFGVYANMYEINVFSLT